MKKKPSAIIIVLIIMLSVLALSVAGGVVAKYITTLQSETVFTIDVGKRYPTIKSNFITSEEDFTISGSPAAGFQITLKNNPSDFTHVAYNVGDEIKYAEVSNKSFTIHTSTQETVTLEKAKMYAFATLDSSLANLEVYNRLNRIATTFTPDNMAKPAHILLLPEGKPAASSDPEKGSQTWRNTAEKDSPAGDSNFRVKVKTVTFQDPIQPTSTRWWFNCFRSCTSFTFTKNGQKMLDTSLVTDMGCMFRFCNAVTSLDLSTFNTAEVTDMERMFSENKALTSLNLSGWNTANVTDMQSMFWTCSALTTLDVSHFNTANVTLMNQMFGQCAKLTHLNLTSFQTGNVTTMEKMFYNCAGLRAVKIGSGWKTAANTSNVFQSSAALVYLDGQLGSNTVTYTGWDAANGKANFTIGGYSATEKTAADVDARIEYGTKTAISVSAANTGGTWDSHVLILKGVKMYAFATLSSDGTHLRVYNRENSITRTGIFVPDNMPGVTVYKYPATTRNGSTSSKPVISADPESSAGEWTVLASTTAKQSDDDPGTVSDNSTVTKITIEDSVKINVTALNPPRWFIFFTNCTAIEGLSKVDTSAVQSMSRMFTYCMALQSLDLSNFNTTKAQGMYKMFFECKSLKTLDLSTFDINAGDPNGAYLQKMFYGCKSLTSITFGAKFNVNRYSDFQEMFRSCENLTSIALDFDVSGAKMYYMFGGCRKLTKVGTHEEETIRLNFTENSSLNNINFAFYNCNSVKKIEFTGFVNTSACTTMQSVFAACKSLTEIAGIEEFNTSNVTTLQAMFSDCLKIKVLDLSSFNTANVTNMQHMFYVDGSTNTNSLQTIYVGAGWTTEKVTNVAANNYMFVRCTNLIGGSGTRYASDETKWGVEYARVDGGTAAPGYLTHISQKNQTLNLDMGSIAFVFADEGQTHLIPGVDNTLLLIAAEGETLPEQLVVTIDGVEYMVPGENDIRYDHITGELILPGTLLTETTRMVAIRPVMPAPISIDISGIDDTGLEWLPISSHEDMAPYPGEDYVISFTAKEGYALPERITVTIDGTSYAVFTDGLEHREGDDLPPMPTFDPSSGRLTIPAVLLTEGTQTVRIEAAAAVEAEVPTCICETKCTDLNADCPVCSTDISTCGGKEQEPTPTCTCETKCADPNAACAICAVNVTGCTGTETLPPETNGTETTPVCICEVKCTAINDGCEVCGTDIAACIGMEQQPPANDPTEETVTPEPTPTEPPVTTPAATEVPETSEPVLTPPEAVLPPEPTQPEETEPEGETE